MSTIIVHRHSKGCKGDWHIANATSLILGMRTEVKCYYCWALAYIADDVILNELKCRKKSRARPKTEAKS